MNIQRRHLVSTLLGTGLLLLLLLLVSLDDLYSPEPPEMVALRDVQMYEPPPPPPPPPLEARDRGGDAGRPLAVASRETQIELQIMALDVELAAGEFGDFGFGTGGLGEGLGFDFGTVSLLDLDSFPVVVRSPVYVYPQELIVSFIDQFPVHFHILIDEEGWAHLIRIVENPYPSENEKLAEFVAGVQFTAPTKLGIPVRTEYLWPVEFRRDRD